MSTLGSTLRNLRGVPEAAAKPNLIPFSHGDLPLVEILKGLYEQEKQEFKGLGRMEHYEPNAVIFNEGTEARNFYLVEEGKGARGVLRNCAGRESKNAPDLPQIGIYS